MSRLAVGFILLVGCLAVPCAAQITSGDTGTTFNLKFTKGDVLKYKFTIDMGGKMESPATFVVKDIAGNLATFSVKMGPSSVDGNVMMEAISIDEKVDLSTGHMTSSEGYNPVFPLPSKPVKVGGTWHSGAAMPLLNEPGDATYTFLGLGEAQGQKVAKISFRIEGGGMTHNQNYQGQATLLVSDGTVLSAKMTGGMEGGSATMAMARILPAPVKAPGGAGR